MAAKFSAEDVPIAIEPNEDVGQAAASVGVIEAVPESLQRGAKDPFDLPFELDHLAMHSAKHPGEFRRDSVPPRQWALNSRAGPPVLRGRHLKQERASPGSSGGVTKTLGVQACGQKQNS